MPGGLIQLSSFGQQDVYLTGSPDVTYFKLAYKRHTPFAMESIQQAFDGPVDFNKQPTVTISRNGDLVGPIWLEVKLPNLLGYDISPMPAEGNTGNLEYVMAQGSVYANASNVYYAIRSGSPGNYTYSNVIAIPDGSGNYYTSGEYGNLSSLTGNIVTWPYMVNDNSPSGWARPTANLRWCNGVGLALIKSVELQIGGQRIDKHYPIWWDIWNELTEKEEKVNGFNEMVGKYSDFGSWQRKQAIDRTYYIPLQFCFNRTPGLYLPLAALQYSQVRLNFEIADYTELINCAVPVTSITNKLTGATPTLTSCDLYADFVYLGAKERLRVSNSDHEYLITQLQSQLGEPITSPTDPNGTVNRKVSLNFIQPVRELIWVYQASSKYAVNAQTGNDIFTYDMPSDVNTTNREIFETAKLTFNGADRFSTRKGSYFRLVQPYEHHTRVPSKSIYVYSFALENAESDLPNGTANMSRLDSVQLSLTLNSSLPSGRAHFFARSFNVLRIRDGIGDVTFSS
jgi:hypothetical protein